VTRRVLSVPGNQAQSFGPPNLGGPIHAHGYGSYVNETGFGGPVVGRMIALVSWPGTGALLLVVLVFVGVVDIAQRRELAAGLLVNLDVRPVPPAVGVGHPRGGPLP